jgi:hypothetical protein
MKTNMKVTEQQIKRTIESWSSYAGELVSIETSDFIGDPIYAFGSELACLRLHYKMKCGRVAFSTNLDSWYYVNQ